MDGFLLTMVFILVVNVLCLYAVGYRHRVELDRYREDISSLREDVVEILFKMDEDKKPSKNGRTMWPETKGESHAG